MKKNIQLLITLAIISFINYSCSKDDEEQRCVKCILDEQYGYYEDFDLCELENGNASLDGNDTGYDYDLVVREFNSDGVYNCN